jgi:hypothetical protein
MSILLKITCKSVFPYKEARLPILRSLHLVVSFYTLNELRQLDKNKLQLIFGFLSQCGQRLFWSYKMATQFE